MAKYSLGQEASLNSLVEVFGLTGLLAESSLFDPVAESSSCTPYAGYGVKSSQGSRPNMEDSYTVQEKLSSPPSASTCQASADLAACPGASDPNQINVSFLSEDLSWFSVYDGHGGNDVALHCSEKLHMHFTQELYERRAASMTRRLQSQQTTKSAAEIATTTKPELAASPKPEEDTTTLVGADQADLPFALRSPLDSQEAPETSVSDVGRRSSISYPPPTISRALQEASETSVSNIGKGSLRPPQVGQESSKTSVSDVGKGSLRPPLDRPEASETSVSDFGKGNSILYPPAMISEALRVAFKKTDGDLAGTDAGEYVGAAAVVAVVGKEHMWIAHCGDSRAVIQRGGASQALTNDHKPDREDEKARIKAAGGRITMTGGAHRVMGMLAMSRAIGDHFLRPYVIAEPEVICIERSDMDEVLVIATDGLWDVFSCTEATSLASRCATRSKERGMSRHGACRIAASVLTKVALERGSRDNITVIVVDVTIDVLDKQHGGIEKCDGDSGVPSSARLGSNNKLSKNHSFTLGTHFYMKGRQQELLAPEESDQDGGGRFHPPSILATKECSADSSPSRSPRQNLDRSLSERMDGGPNCGGHDHSYSHLTNPGSHVGRTRVSRLGLPPSTGTPKPEAALALSDLSVAASCPVQLDLASCSADEFEFPLPQTVRCVGSAEAAVAGADATKGGSALNEEEELVAGVLMEREVGTCGGTGSASGDLQRFASGLGDGLSVCQRSSADAALITVSQGGIDPPSHSLMKTEALSDDDGDGGSSCGTSTPGAVARRESYEVDCALAVVGSSSGGGFAAVATPLAHQPLGSPIGSPGGEACDTGAVCKTAQLHAV